MSGYWTPADVGITVNDGRITAIVMESPDGTLWSVTVDDTGDLDVEEVT